MRPLQEVLLPVDIQIKLASRNYAGVVDYSDRVGVMWHFDASRTDQGALNWFDDPAFLLSYNRAYTDNGRRIGLTPRIEQRAYHAGTSREDARVHGGNTAFYGLCVTAGDGQVATDLQFAAICVDTAVIAKYHQLRGDDGWETSNIGYWLTGHENWAIYGPKDTARKDLWGKLGRKHDPTGSDPANPVLSLAGGRKVVTAYLEDPALGAFWKSYDFGVAA
jgi:hypothetical protein